MTFLGLLVLEDPLRVGIAETLQKLLDLGIATKLITGDNRLVAAHVARQAGLPGTQVLTGSDLQADERRGVDSERAGEVSVFAEVEPNQKERIILALKKAGHVVGYMGDGINDASALHAADVGISVADAVDVAKEAADFVLLEKDLGVLERGVREGRATFANTMKYVFMATSANFGNMFSMAGASLFLPFLPLLPKQVLLMNLLTDLPEMTIATDRGRPRDGGAAPALGHRLHPPVHDRLRRDQLSVRLPDVRGASPGPSCPGNRTPHGLVRGVGGLVRADRARDADPAGRSTGADPADRCSSPPWRWSGSRSCCPTRRWPHSLASCRCLPSFSVALGPIVLLYVVAAEAAKSVFYRSEERRSGSTAPPSSRPGRSGCPTE